MFSSTVSLSTSYGHLLLTASPPYKLAWDLISVFHPAIRPDTESMHSLLQINTGDQRRNRLARWKKPNSQIFKFLHSPSYILDKTTPGLHLQIKRSN